MLEFRHEKKLPKPVAGVDEAGRGPLAGPVIAAAVILVEAKMPEDLRLMLKDSKKLTAKRRQLIFNILADGNGVYAFTSLGGASATVIDHLNVFQASGLAMKRAVAGLIPKPQSVLVDGKYSFNLAKNAVALVRGDAKSPSVAAASIVAKVVRDKIMVALDSRYPQFEWQQNKGYGTKEHLAGLATHKPSVHHRLSFKPVADLLRDTPEV